MHGVSRFAMVMRRALAPPRPPGLPSSLHLAPHRRRLGGRVGERAPTRPRAAPSSPLPSPPASVADAARAPPRPNEEQLPLRAASGGGHQDERQQQPAAAAAPTAQPSGNGRHAITAESDANPAPVPAPSAAAKADSPAATAGATAAAAAPDPSLPWRSVALLTGLTLFQANAHRSAFAALLPPLLSRLSLTPSAAGALQSSMLIGYLAMQVPAGRWADRWGGCRVLLWSCAAWSLATGLTAAAVAWASAAAAAAGATAAAAPASLASAPMAALVASRFLFGAASAGVMPCVAAMAVAWPPRRQRAASTSLVYAAFNLGGVAALALAPAAAEVLGGGGAAAALAPAAAEVLGGGGAAAAAAAAAAEVLGGGAAAAAAAAEATSGGAAGALLALGVAGAAWAAAGGAWLRSLWGVVPEGHPHRAHKLQKQQERQQASAAAKTTTAATTAARTMLLPRPADADSAREVFTLCFAHGAIGCGFFLLSGLMPLILASIGGGGGGGGGPLLPLPCSPAALTALPWLVAAATGVLAGRAADVAIARGASPLSVRRAFQVASFSLCALSVAPLALPASLQASLASSALGSAVAPRAAAALLLAGNLVAYSLSFGGFHAYLQDVAGAEAAGLLQGLTNSVSIACGCAATLFCGWAGEAHGGSYGSAFAGLAALYALAAGVWAWGARGSRVRLVAAVAAAA